MIFRLFYENSENNLSKKFRKLKSSRLNVPVINIRY